MKILRTLERYSINIEEYLKLSKIGGHSTYHLEGNALQHSFLVWENSLQIFPNNEVMQKAALLHDIGKIYTSIEIAPNDWIYPDHTTCGSLKGILCKFIPLPWFASIARILWIAKSWDPSECIIRISDSLTYK